MTKRTCSIDGCERTHFGRGWCHLHYTRWWKYDDPLGSASKAPDRLCKVDGCNNKHLSKGMCLKHYHRMRRYGTTELPSAMDRFWERVKKTSTCWLWQGARGEYGHPNVKIDGKIEAVYRVAWKQLRGPIPKGLVLDHLCRVPWCVNPDHLEPVTNGENVLRGIGPGAINARKTHCIRGHELVPRPSNPRYRHCPTCSNENQRKRRAKKQQQLAAVRRKGSD